MLQYRTLFYAVCYQKFLELFIKNKIIYDITENCFVVEKSVKSKEDNSCTEKDLAVNI